MVWLNEGERIDELYHQGLRVIQNPAAPAFSMDAVILADFTQVHDKERIIDLGTGCGVISLLLANKAPKCQIWALELMPPMADMASRSVELNGLAKQISIICGDIRRSTEYFGRSLFDIVVSNPPYYKAGTGRISADPLRAAARSETYCSLSELFDSVVSLLKPYGRFYIVHRAERLTELLTMGEARKLHCTRLRMVQPRIDRCANLLLAQFVFGGREQLVVDSPLIIYEQEAVYSAEMRRIYQGQEGNALARNAIRSIDPNW